MYPDARADLNRLIEMFSLGTPFRFIRFSDGEMEILRNEPLEISLSHLNWRKGSVRHSLPAYDVKQFSPERDQLFRRHLLESAQHRGPSFIKGIPSSHVKQDDDRDLMVELNGGFDSNLTFADLLINSNYRRFLRLFLPLILTYSDVFVIGNFRMRPELANPTWQLIAIPDNFFGHYPGIMEQVVAQVEDSPPGALILSSASSLSNVVGHSIDVRRPDLTFIDIGTALHGFMGLDPAVRDYHLDGLPWKISNFFPKLRYRLAPHYKIRW